MATSNDVSTEANNDSYLNLFWTFLKIGSTAFGGFMALISVVQNYVVDRRKLLSHEDMLDGISLATILPGPVAVNVVAYAGYKIKGIFGALICATAVILPSFLLLLFLSYMYFAYGEIPAVSDFFKGFLPAVAAIIVAAAWNMGKKSLKHTAEYSIAIVAMGVLIFVGGFFSTLGIIVASGIVGYLIFREKKQSDDTNDSDDAGSEPKPSTSQVNSVAVLPVAAMAISLWNTNMLLLFKLFINFAGMSLLLFGGGFVFIPLMQETVVDTYGWVTQKEFIDAIALGQVTPGPILISATFIGYKVAGILGATLSTVAIFAPPAIVMLICTHYLQKIKDSANIQSILKGIRSGVIGMIAAAAYIVILSAEQNWVSVAIFVLALLALLKLKLEVVWIIPTAGLAGLLLY